METSWRDEVPTEHATYALQENSGSLAVNGFIHKRPTLITADTAATVSTVCPALAKISSQFGALAPCEQLLEGGKGVWESGNIRTPGST